MRYRTLFGVLLGAAIMGEAQASDLEQDGLRDFDKLWNYGDPAGTEKEFREVLKRVLKAETPDPAYVAELKTQIARTRGLQKDYDGAHAILDEVQGSLRDEDRVAHLRVLLERGRTLRSSGSPDRAKPIFLEAWEKGRQWNQDFHAVDAGHMVALVEKDDAALAWNVKTIDYAKKSKSKRVRGWCGSLYINLAWSYHDSEEYEKALECFAESLKIREEQGKPEGIRTGKWYVARCLRSMKRYDEALKIQTALLEAGRKEDRKDPFVIEEMGELLWATGKKEEARPYFKEAHELLSKIDWVAEDKKRLERIKELAGKE